MKKNDSNLKQKQNEELAYDCGNYDCNDCDCQKLNQDLKNLQLQLEDTKSKWLRSVADYQNLEKRLEKEKQEWIMFGNTNLLLRLLEVADNLDRASNFIKDPGLEMVNANLHTILKEFGVEKIKIEKGQEYTHECMECIEQREGEENKVLDIAQPGYKLHEKILRPAKVVVGKKK